MSIETVTKAEFWEMMAYAYRSIAERAHMKHFIPKCDGFRTQKKRFALIDEAAKLVAREILEQKKLVSELEEKYFEKGGNKCSDQASAK